MSEDEDEILLYVEVNGLLDAEVLEETQPFFKIIDIDSDQPIMQIGREVFCGEYRDVLGTALFFEEDPLPPGVDPVFGKIANIPLRYVCKTNKSLVMNRVFLKDKSAGGGKIESVKTNCDQPQANGSGTNPTVDQTTYIECGKQITRLLQEKKEISQSETCDGTFVDSSVVSEPTPGPSWASDVLPLEKPLMNRPSMQTGCMDASTEEVSKLIAEHMNISSDRSKFSSLN